MKAHRLERETKQHGLVVRCTVKMYTCKITLVLEEERCWYVQ